jgi:hypothetical protein
LNLQSLAQTNYYSVYTRPEKPRKVIESENQPKTHGIVMENRENLKKTWNLPLGQKFKILKLIIKPFRKRVCGAFPLIFFGVLHIAYFI